MAEDLHYSSRSEHKRKFDDQGTPPPPAASASGRRSTGFSAPIVSQPSEAAAPLSYNSVPPPPDGIQLAKQRAQEIAARIFSDAEAKRPKVENGGGADDSSNKGYDFDQPHNSFGQPLASQSAVNTPSSFASYGYGGASKRVDIPNERVGVIIGKSGETIKYLQVQSGARIQVTRDMDADPHSQSRPVELIGTPEQISKAEQLINEVLAEAVAGGPGIISGRKFTSTTSGNEHFSMKVPNNKVGLIIGKGGETIKNMQLTSGARIQVIPLHLQPGDPSMERTVHIDGTNEQIESAKQLVNDVISENRPRNTQTTGGYRPPRPPTSWAPPAAPTMQQPGYGYMQPGAYPGQPPQYMSQPPYSGYLPPASTGWDQSSNSAAQQTTGYDYYSQQQQLPPPPESSAPTDSNSYNYSQIPPTYSAPGSYGDSTFSHSAAGQQQGYAQAAAAGYAQPGSQAGYAQPGYAQPAYGSGSGYSSTAGSAQEAAPQQAPTPGQYSTASQGYGVPPASQYGSQPATQPGYLPAASPGQQGYGQSPQGQKQSLPQPAYGQGQQPATASQVGYAQAAQTYGQPAAASGYAQSGYGQQPPYVQQQQQQSYSDSYAGAYAQPSYSSDAAHGSYEAPSSAQAAPAKASPQS